MQEYLNEAYVQTAELQYRYQTEFERSAAHGTKLDAVSEELRAALAEHHALEITHNEQTASYREEVSQLQHKLILSGDQVKTLEVAKAALETQLTLQVDQVLRLENCLLGAEVAEKQAKTTIAELQQKEAALEADSEAIRQQNVELQDVVDALQRELQVAYTAAAEPEERIYDSTMDPSSTQTNELVMTFEEQLEAVRERNTELEVRSVLQEATSSIADRHELSQMEANLGTAQHELQLAQAELTAQRFVIRTLESELEAALLQVESLQRAVVESASAVVAEAINRQDITESRLVASEERSETRESQISAIKADYAEAQSQVTELQVRLDEASGQTIARELNAAQGTKLNAVSEELRVALEECQALKATHATQETSQRTAMSQLQQTLVVADGQITTLKSQVASHMAQAAMLQQECGSKAAATLALKSENEEAISSCISLNNNISALETQLGHLERELSCVKSESNEQSIAITSQQERVVSLELELAAASTEYRVLQERLRDCERELIHQKEHANKTLESQNTTALLQAEHSAQVLAITQHHDEERQRMQETYEQELTSIQNELMTVNSREVNALRSKICELQADLDTKLLELHELQASEELRLRHQQELVEAQSKIDSLQEELEAATLAVDCAESKTAALTEQHSAQTLKLKQFNEDHISLTGKLDSQTLALSALEAEVEALSNMRCKLERQVSDKKTEIESLRSECARLAGEYDLQTSLLAEQKRDEIREATRQIHDEWELKYHAQREELQTLEASVARMSHERAAREQLVQSLTTKVADLNSNHATELLKWETKFHDKVVELQREIETRTPDEIRKLRAQVEAARVRADDFEATYKAELENKLQLEFGLASVQKELHLTKQQLTAHDPLQTEHHALEARMLRLKERETELCDREQALLMHRRTPDIEHGQQVKHCDDEPSSRLTLDVRIFELTRQLQEADCRSAMQAEELHSYRSWVTLQEVLRRALANRGSDDAYIDHTTTPEAKRLVMKHLHSLDNWFDRAILGKSVEDDGHSESLDTITEGNELSELQDPGGSHGEGAGSCRYATSTRRLLRRRDNRASESSDSDASDCDEAVSANLDDLGDELLVMCDENAQQHSGQLLSADAGEIAPHALTRMFCTEASERRGSGGFAFSSGGGGPKDAQSDIAQLKLTILGLKEVLDAKEETVLFLDDKMKYYEELLSAGSQS